MVIKVQVQLLLPYHIWLSRTQHLLSGIHLLPFIFQLEGWITQKAFLCSFHINSNLHGMDNIRLQDLFLPLNEPTQGIYDHWMSLLGNEMYEELFTEITSWFNAPVWKAIELHVGWADQGWCKQLALRCFLNAKIVQLVIDDMYIILGISFSMDFSIFISKILLHNRYFCWTFNEQFYVCFEGGEWLPWSPLGLWVGLWWFFLLWWFLH